MSQRSKRLLIHFLKNVLFWPSTIIPLLSVALILYAQIDASKFGNSNSAELLKIWWAFDPSHPERHFFMPFLFSFLSHSSLQHWISNILPFALLAGVFHRKTTIRFTHVFIFTSQILVNLLMVLMFLFIKTPTNHYFLGLSGVTLALLGGLGSIGGRAYFVSTLVALGYFSIELIRHTNLWIEPSVHLLFLLCGFLIGKIRKKSG